MSSVDLKTIRKAITDQKANWKAKDHPFLQLSAEETKRHLGVIVDEQRLQELRAQPKPDMARVIAQFKGLHLSETTHAKAHEMTQQPGGSLKKHAYALDERILASIREYLTHIFFEIVDWREDRDGQNDVTGVKDQGGCGSCVSFGTIGTLESMVLIEHDVSLDLSEAELLFCGGGGCGGWWPDSAVTYLLNDGVALESCFPYQDHDMPCTTCGERTGEAIQITNHTVLFDIAQRKHYLANIGPVMCVFEVYDDFFGYSSGVYSHVSGGFAGLHCVEVIGYDDLAGCWTCKNSWGSGWGDNGYFRIAYGQCGIDSTYPFWGISGTHWHS